jgi:transposase
MLTTNPSVPIYLHSEPIDMRKSFDGLFGIIKSDLNRDVRDGGLFMFLNQRLNRLKILYWDTDGIAIWMKRLEQGCFQKAASLRRWQACDHHPFGAPMHPLGG